MLLPSLAIMGIAVVGFLMLARRESASMPRPTQLRAHQQQEGLSIDNLESPSLEPGLNEIGEARMDDAGEISEKPAEEDHALVVGGKPPYACFVGYSRSTSIYLA